MPDYSLKLFKGGPLTGIFVKKSNE